MRKFTKEIAALLAAVSVSTSANMAMTNTETTHAASNAAEQNQPSFTTTAGAVAATTRVGTEVATTATTTRAKVTSQLAPAPGSTMPPDEDVTFPPEDGVAMPPDEYTTTTKATTTTTIGTQTSKLTTTTTTTATTTTTTVGTVVSKLTTTTAVPSNDRIELPLEEIEIGEALFNNDEIEDHYASFYAQCAEYVVLQYSVEGDCDEIEGVFVTAIDHEMVEEFFTAAVKNGIATVSYRVPFNSDDFITAAVFDSKEKGVNLEKVELVNLESGRTTTTFPPLMGTIVATTETTTVPPLAGVPLPPDEYTTTTVPPLAGVTTSTRPRQTDIPPLMGTQTIPTSTTTQTYIAGGMMPSDEKTTTTTTTTTPTIGTQMPTTVSTTIPPLMGDMQIYIDGDANNDSTVSIADAAAILQYIANPDKYELSENGMKAADVVGNGNGITADDAIAIQKLDAKLIEDFSELE
ncbi:MAG: dockerin type I repeat-containing protein [Ruminococcus sp.]|nr:dockerin type I repeat-containing protein [Ruminococcus sp.]